MDAIVTTKQDVSRIAFVLESLSTLHGFAPKGSGHTHGSC